MPHQCTNCGRRFPDGSKEMLSGCPDCGGHKFQFRPAGSDPPTAGSEPADSPSDPDPETTSSDASLDSSDASLDSSDASLDSSDAPLDPSPDASLEFGDSSIIDADDRDDLPEDSAQASARSTVVSENELRTVDDPPEGPDGDAAAPSEEAEVPAETPDLSALREELDDQFESIKILEPGQYELNLMELYDRDEYIIALEEDGRYAIEVPDTWREDE